MAGVVEKARRFWHAGDGFRERFGLVAGTRLSWQYANAKYRGVPGTLVRVGLPESGRTVELRAGSSDAEVYQQLVLNRELDVDLSPPPARIIDGGANFGLASLLMAAHWPEARIVSVELERGNFELAQRNCAGVSAIDVRHAALWGSSGRVAIANPAADAHSFRAESGTGATSVRAYRVGELLDELGWDTVDLVKLDIEGAERQVLGDGAAWLPRVRHLLVELHDRFEPGCSEALTAALAGGDWDVRQQGEYQLASRRNG
ncbi:MAG: FkbM family methyltransferase [Gemmatimonadota bacterium]